jgi:hypothetical protein
MTPFQGVSFPGRRTNEYIGAELFKLLSGNSVDGEEILDALEWPAPLTELHDGFGRRRPDAGQLFELLDGRRIQIERLGRRPFLRRGGGEREQ